MIQLKWSSLLRITELEFIPEAPSVLKVSDEIMHTLAWLTAATSHDRRLIRCDENGALLVGHPWSLLHTVDTDELNPADGVPDVTAALAVNVGVLVASSGQLVKIDIVRVSGGASETFYIPPGQYLWFPYSTYTVTATAVPATGGTASYVGLTAFK